MITKSNGNYSCEAYDVRHFNIPGFDNNGGNISFDAAIRGNHIFITSVSKLSDDCNIDFDELTLCDMAKLYMRSHH